MTQTPVNPLGRPELPRKFRPRIIEEPNRLEITFARRDWGTAVFMVFWLLPWTAGCLAILTNALSGQIFLFLFGLPFWLAWFLVVFSVFDALFRVEKLVIDQQAARYTWRVLFNLQDSNYLALDLKPIDNTQPDKEKTGAYRLKLCGRNKDLLFFRGLKEEEAAWLQPIVNAHLARIVGYAAGAGPAQSREPFPSLASAQDIETWQLSQADANDQTTSAQQPNQDRPQTADSTGTWLEPGPTANPPQGTKWQAVPSFQELCLAKKGKFNPLGFVLILVFATFWNGIIFTLLSQSLGLFSPSTRPDLGSGERLFTLVFLTPFVLIGLGLIVMALMALFSGFYRETWSFGYRGIQHKAGYLGLGKTREWDVIRLSGLLLKAGKQPKNLHDKWSARQTNEHVPKALQKMVEAYATFDLCFIDRSGNEVCRMTGLSQEEARWIGSQVISSRREWFR